MDGLESALSRQRSQIEFCIEAFVGEMAGAPARWDLLQFCAGHTVDVERTPSK